MFGHQDSTNQDSAVQPAATQDDDNVDQSIAPQTIAPTADTSADATSNDDYVMPEAGAEAPAPEAEAAPEAEPAPAVEEPAAAEIPVVAAAPAAEGSADLLELKLAALHELTPLLDHLEQTAEEKFRTMMMMIQAADDQTLLAEAYQAAHSIEDKKVRAQALLDVVNEINYFTQQHAGDSAQH